jgi:hypothetical protein
MKLKDIMEVVDFLYKGDFLKSKTPETLVTIVVELLSDEQKREILQNMTTQNFKNSIKSKFYEFNLN